MTLKQYLGDSVTHTIRLTWLGASFTPGNEWALIFTAKTSGDDEDTAALIQKTSGAGITTSTTNALVTLVPDDTSALAAGNIVWDVQGQSSVTDEVRTLAEGTLTLKRDKTRGVTTTIPVITTETPLPFGHIAAETHAATAKTTLADLDEIPLADSAASFGIKKISGATLRSQVAPAWAVITAGKTLTLTNSITLSGTDGSTLNIGAGGTLGTAAYCDTSTGVGSTDDDGKLAKYGVSGGLEAKFWRSKYTVNGNTISVTVNYDLIDFQNAAGGTTTINCGNTSASSYTISFPAASGTVALTSDIPTTAAEVGAATIEDAIGLTQFVALTEDEDLAANSETLQTSATLQVPLTPGTYLIRALTVINGNAAYAAAGTRHKLTFSGTGSFVGGAIYRNEPASTIATSYPTTRLATTLDTERVSTGLSAATFRMGKLVVTASGSLVIQGAQRTATADAYPSLAAPSYIEATRIA